MQDGDADGNPGDVDRKKHDQLPGDGTRARVRVRPVAVPDEIADDRANEGNRSSRDELHVRHLREQVHHPEVDHRADYPDDSKF